MTREDFSYDKKTNKQTCFDALDDKFRPKCPFSLTIKADHNIISFQNPRNPYFTYSPFNPLIIEFVKVDSKHGEIKVPKYNPFKKNYNVSLISVKVIFQSLKSMQFRTA